MLHTFLYEEGIWRMKGRVTAPNGITGEVTGTGNIRHEGKLWLRSGTEEIALEEPTILKHVYRIIPFGKNSPITFWDARCPIMGSLQGQFILVDDDIVANFQSRDGRYSGSEYFRRISNYEYYNRAVVMSDGKRFMTWSIEYERKS